MDWNYYSFSRAPTRPAHIILGLCTRYLFEVDLPMRGTLGSLSQSLDSTVSLQCPSGHLDQPGLHTALLQGQYVVY